MSINYNKYIFSTGTHYIANSGGDSKGGISGDKAGDQNGKEWQLRSWYNRPWTCVLRHPDPKVRRLIAELGIEGALNDLIGYDQGQRTTFWAQLKVSGYRPANIKVACEEDCSAGVSSIIKAVGFLLGIVALQNVSSSNSSRTIREALLKAGFVELTASKYRTSGKYNLPGDVLLYVNHHVAINITRGKLAEGEVADSVDTSAPDTYKLGERELRDGCTGSDVVDLQKALIALGYSCGSCGADGEYGSDTAKAVKKFQTAKGLPATGVADSATIKAILTGDDLTVTEKPVSGPCVTISGCTACNIRTGPGKEYKSVGEAHSGDVFSAPETENWVPIIHNGAVAWVSGLYAQKVGD